MVYLAQSAAIAQARPFTVRRCSGAASRCWRQAARQACCWSTPTCSLSAFSTYFGTRLSWSRPCPGSTRLARLEIGRQCSTRVQRATASFFGVGAPEAFVIGVVALLVFGPKGLAEAAQAIGKTLRSFQPTLRELADVSNELKSTLEKEIGIDEIREELRRPPSTSTGTSPASSSGLPGATVSPVSDVLAKVVDPDIETKRQEAAAAAWGPSATQTTTPDSDSTPSPSAQSSQSTQSTPIATSSAQADKAPAVVQAPLANLSMDELEKEIARRKAAGSKDSK